MNQMNQMIIELEIPALELEPGRWDFIRFVPQLPFAFRGLTTKPHAAALGLLVRSFMIGGAEHLVSNTRRHPVSHTREPLDLDALSPVMFIGVQGPRCFAGVTCAIEVGLPRDRRRCSFVAEVIGVYARVENET